MLRRAPSLTDQVKTHLKDMIVNGEFPGGRIPPETELAEALGVSRTTVRDALSRLEMEGSISRRQGAGTFVNKPVLQIRSRLEEIWSYEAMLQAHGFTPSTRVIDAIAAPVSALPYDDAAADLGISPHDSVLYIRKLFLEDDVPVILAINVVPRPQELGGYTAADLGRPIYDFLDDLAQRRLSYYVTDVVPVLANGETAALLRVAAGTPLVSFDETGYADANQPIVKAYSYFRDDLLRLRLLRRRV